MPDAAMVKTRMEPSVLRLVARTAGRWLLILAALAIPAAASAAPAETGRFDPPVGRTFRLHSETVQTRAQAGRETVVQTSAGDEDLVFSPAPEAGWLLRWTTRSVSVHAAAERQAVMEKAAAVFIDKPLVIRLDEDGAPTGVVNIAEVRAVVLESLEGIARSFATDPDRPAAEREAARQAVAGIVAGYRAMSDDRFAETLLEEPRTLFGFGAAAFGRGQSIPFATTAMLPLTGTSIRLTGEVSVKAETPGEITFAAASRSDPADIEAAAGTFLQTLTVGLPAEQRDRLAAAARQLKGFQSNDALTLTVRKRDGLPISATYVRRTAVGDQIRSDTKTYRLN